MIRKVDNEYFHFHDNKQLKQKQKQREKEIEKQTREREREEEDDIEYNNNNNNNDNNSNNNNNNNNSNNNNNNSNNIIKSRLCLQISVKSTSKYRLCDSNPQDEGDSNWAIITGIYQQSFILRGDNCDFQDKLVSSDGLVTVHMNEEEL